MAKKNDKNLNAAPQGTGKTETQYSLNDDRRVKVLSPGALVAKRFFRNRLAVTGLSILLFMFLFSFVGGIVSPYKEAEIFYRTDSTKKEYCSVLLNNEYRYLVNDADVYTGIVQAQTILAIQQNAPTFLYKDTEFELQKEGEDFYSVYHDGALVGAAYKDIVHPANDNDALSFAFSYAALKAFTSGEPSFTADGKTYQLNELGVISENGSEIGYISRLIVKASFADVVISKRFREELTAAIEKNDGKFEFTDDEGKVIEYKITYNPARLSYSVKQATDTRVIDTYSAPSKAHPLGTDRNGMDMLTRLMYGGRVSLIIGFIVVFIETGLGIIFGGISGYFGGWVDNLIMRIVDIFYCIPSLPMLIILGASMDKQNVDPKLRMLYLMLLLGFLGWPSIARLVRGQILSLREQEFMTAAEAGGVRVSRRIFKHLIPNVIPQLIVTCTMGLGSTIITEATLSFLGIGVRFPFASWGNIINDVNDTFVLTTYLFIWIPAGVCLLATVLAFNLVGDGLRDAFDPKMKR